MQSWIIITFRVDLEKKNTIPLHCKYYNPSILKIRTCPHATIETTHVYHFQILPMIRSSITTANWYLHVVFSIHENLKSK
ncbi:hypothetical protein A4A49_27238 [Nicotiana attenuata]|uniref:Uncharacterized protein n=1 Tax=Nicotiana attenuata TaxID=49451 RepID=A0A1J6I7A5_NICAT|nr:hypothetical protein A4A49_27238 [Nicotiana attenuata]